MICVCLSLDFRHGLDLFDIRFLMNGGHGFLIIKLLVNPPSPLQFFLAATTALTRELSPKIELRTKTNWFHTTMPKNLYLFLFLCSMTFQNAIISLVGTCKDMTTTSPF
uniref:Uncharacterized protein n=2 Tax=Manihot esculenta TaxID=3983 RepID=A0A2C9V705_MANES